MIPTKESSFRTACSSKEVFFMSETCSAKAAQGLLKHDAPIN